MRVHEFERLVIDLLEKDDHPEIVRVRALAEDAADQRHTRVRVDFASGATGYVIVGQVAGPGIRPHGEFELPKDAF